MRKKSKSAMPLGPSPLLHVTARIEEIEIDLRAANALATKCPLIVELLVNPTGRKAKKVMEDGDACAQIRAAIAAYSAALDVALASPLRKLQAVFGPQADAVLPISEGKVNPVSIAP